MVLLGLAAIAIGYTACCGGRVSEPRSPTTSDHTAPERLRMERKRLSLHFQSKKYIDVCLAEMKALPNVPKFEIETTSIDTRDILTKPEFLDIEAKVDLVFENEEAAKGFMAFRPARQIYDKYANKE